MLGLLAFTLLYFSPFFILHSCSALKTISCIAEDEDEVGIIRTINYFLRKKTIKILWNNQGFLENKEIIKNHREKEFQIFRSFLGLIFSNDLIIIILFNYFFFILFQVSNYAGRFILTGLKPVMLM